MALKREGFVSKTEVVKRKGTTKQAVQDAIQAGILDFESDGRRTFIADNQKLAQWRPVPGIVYVTSDGVEIFVKKGGKPQSPLDFKVTFKDRRTSNRQRTPRHVHLVVELYVAEVFDKRLTHQLRDHLLWVVNQVRPITSLPPSLQVFQPQHTTRFKRLEQVTEFSIEFLLVVNELIFIQEKTNYPQGPLTQRLYENFGREDRFSVIQTALLRGR